MVSKKTVIFATKNNNNYTELMNLLENSGYNVKVCKNASEKIAEMAQRFKATTVILNIDAFENKDLACLMDYLYRLKPRPTVINIYTYYDFDKFFATPSFTIVTHIRYPVDTKQLIEKLESGFRFADRSLEEIIDELKRVIIQNLNALNVLENSDSYNYILDSILLLVLKRKYRNSFSKGLYIVVSKRYNISPACLEHSIRRNIGGAWSRTNIQIKKIYFKITFSKDTPRPTNNKFLKIISDKIKHEYLDLIDMLEAVSSSEIAGFMKNYFDLDE